MKISFTIPENLQPSADTHTPGRCSGEMVAFLDGSSSRDLPV